MSFTKSFTNVLILQYLENKQHETETSCFAYFIQPQPIQSAIYFPLGLHSCIIQNLLYINTKLQGLQNIFLRNFNCSKSSLNNL